MPEPDPIATPGLLGSNPELTTTALSTLDQFNQSTHADFGSSAQSPFVLNASEPTAPDLSDPIESIVVTAPHWRDGEESLYQQLIRPLWLGGAGMQDGSDEAARTASALYSSVNAWNNPSDAAVLNDMVNPVLLGKHAAIQFLNTLNKSAAGLASLASIGSGLDQAISTREAVLSYQIQDHAPFAEMVGADLRAGADRLLGWSEDNLGLGATSILGSALEFANDVGILGAGVFGLSRLSGELPAGLGAGRGVTQELGGLDVGHDVAQRAVATELSHPLAGLSADEVIQMATLKGLQTPRDSLLLWSGFGREGVDRSQAFAKAFGGVTLELTDGGKWLNSMDLYGVSSPSPFSQAQADMIWGEVSSRMVGQAAGQVRSVLGQVSPGSTYMKYELPALEQNTAILGLDSIQLQPRIRVTGH